MIRKTFKKAFIGSLIAGGLGVGCASTQIPGDGNKLVDAKADVKAVGFDKSVRQSIATSQPITAGRDAANISPVVTINGSDSILLALCGLGVLSWIAGKGWLKSHRTIGVMVKAIDDAPNSDQVKKEIERKAYESGVAQEIWNRVHRNRKRNTKTGH